MSRFEAPLRTRSRISDWRLVRRVSIGGLGCLLSDDVEETRPLVARRAFSNVAKSFVSRSMSDATLSLSVVDAVLKAETVVRRDSSGAVKSWAAI